MNKLYLAWWNLENLFDIEKSQYRDTWLQEKLKDELKGWNAEVLKRKIGQLSKIIKQMNNEQGPDLLGVCEVESRHVLKQLAASLGNQYDIIHADTNDKRGIDVAFIYNSHKITPILEETQRGPQPKVYSHVVMKRNATRDILQAELIWEGHPFIVIANHWPSRSGGELKSEPYRMMAGETLAYWMDRIQDIRPDVPAIVMGDFNDEPSNRSLTEYALSTREHSKAASKRARNPYLYNLTTPLLGAEIGTHKYQGEWGFLDQMLANRAALNNNNIHYNKGSISIVANNELIKAKNRPLNQGQPRRFNRPSSKYYDPEGYSDHLPVSIELNLPK
ncbi:endonuclease/exonuclease/phosphatase family protein [Vibrio atypicus]|uniref:endonuclease/exonuclease/phosphatase family protein n=1 Tax=Vibrio atypicus TaxID=558271 RepID=UPI00135B7110|nr:endonuclease/exonuclease/phosphatase family protein [Vibrio atypicus]